MENTFARLLLLKAQLYALLATLGGLLLIIVSFIFWQSETPAQAANNNQPGQKIAVLNPRIAAGKELFITNCAACHSKSMVDDLTGPALRGVEERWAAYPRQDLYRWIRHSQQMIQARHPRAIELKKKWGTAIMTDFPDLSDEQMEQILAYIRDRS